MVAVAMVGALFSSDAWNNITFTGAEVKHPQRNLPLALALGVGIVTLLYIGANFAFLNVLPLQGDIGGLDAIARGIEHAAEDRVATAVAEIIFGSAGAIVMAIAIMVSTFGCNNGIILAGARVYYAMAQDGMFFRTVGTLNRARVPATALLVQGVWAGMLCLTGSYSQLLDFLIFAVLLFYILTVVGLLVLRHRAPDLPRPYRVVGYPVMPIFYILLAASIEMALLLYKPQYTWPGVIIVLLGIPVYFVRNKIRAARNS